MAKGAGRKMSEKAGSPSRDVRLGSVGRALSPEEAEKAAAAFSPLWQLDDAPFALGARVSANEDLRALAQPVANPVTLDLGPTPTVRAAPAADVAPEEGAPDTISTGNGSPAAEPEPARGAGDIALVVAAHQPIQARPTQPSLPSIIVEQSDAASLPPVAAPEAELPPTPAQPAPFQTVTAPMVVVARPPAPATPKVEPPAPLREPKTDPPAARARPAYSDPDSAYRVPRSSRMPMVLASVIIGSGALVFSVYMLTSPAPVPPVAHTETTARAALTTEPGPVIPPPPPVADEPPPVVVQAPTPPPVAVPPPPPVTQVAAPPVLPPPVTVTTPRSTTHATSPVPRPPPATHAGRPPAAKNSPTPASGGIVRDNPF